MIGQVYQCNFPPLSPFISGPYGTEDKEPFIYTTAITLFWLKNMNVILYIFIFNVVKYFSNTLQILRIMHAYLYDIHMKNINEQL